ncbi:MAG: hypothetical protein ABGY71_04425 [bacterium]|nr:hypothetical protein [Planctomycetota bacterium]HIL51696.1 hypothetical protein [Planctomycetota bacterium]
MGLKTRCADLLLVAGVVTACLAAGESRRVSRLVALADAQGEVLHRAISRAGRTLAAGTLLDGDDLAWLRAGSPKRVSVLRQRQSSEELPLDNPALLGRVLSAGIVLEAESDQARPGRILDGAFVQRLRALNLGELRVSHREATVEGGLETVEIVWDLNEASANPTGLHLTECRLAQELTLPPILKPGTFLDAHTIERLAASGHAAVAVKIPVPFSLAGWGWRWVFVAGALLLLAGVWLKRGHSGAAADGQEISHVAALVDELLALEKGLDELDERAEHLDSAALQVAIDPLLTGPAYRFAEGREALRRAHGTEAYIAVMEAFARAERKLNRAWSAAVDGYPGEARRSLEAARLSAREAREAMPGTYEALHGG